MTTGFSGLIIESLNLRRTLLPTDGPKKWKIDTDALSKEVTSNPKVTNGLSELIIIAHGVCNLCV